RVEWSKRDRYKRIIGRVYFGDRDISLEMVKDGFAWHYKRYSKEAALADAEKDARKAGKGLWADKDPVAPWDWRRGRKGKKWRAGSGGRAVVAPAPAPSVRFPILPTPAAAHQSNHAVRGIESP